MMPDSAIRFSFYNKLFDMSDKPTRLSPPQRDFRKYSLPLSMRFRQESPVPSMSNAFNNATPWRSFTNGKKTKLQDKPLRFKWTVNDEDGQEIKNSLFDSLSSPTENLIGEQCLHFEENFVKPSCSYFDNFDQLNEKFLKKLQECDGNESFFGSQLTTETVMNTEMICKNCGHDIMRLWNINWILI